MAKQDDVSTPTPRWYRRTPDWLILALLLADCLLGLSERFEWFAFNHHKGYAVVIAAAAAYVAFFLMLFRFAASQRLRKPFQFRIRTLPVLAAAVAILCSVGTWLAVEMKAAKKQNEAVEAIRKLGGWVRYDWDWHDSNKLPPSSLRYELGDDFFGAVYAAGVSQYPVHRRLTDAGLEPFQGLTELRHLSLECGDEVTDAGLAHLQGLTKLESLDLLGTQVTDAGLEHLQGMTKLQALTLVGTQVSGVGLEHLKGLTELQSLHLNGAKVSDAGWEHLQSLTNLQKLQLWGPQMTDVGLEHLRGLNQLEWLGLCHIPVTDAKLVYLQGLPKLRMLDLENTKVTDAGLEHLKGLKQLRVLYLNGSQVTDAGVKRLQQALPTCTIIQVQTMSKF